jgi:glycosyltransferase involved in cell wall biosynthesis
MIAHDNAVPLSVIVPVGRRHGDAEELFAEYAHGLDALGMPYELIFVLDGPRDRFAEGLKRLSGKGHAFTALGLTRSFGEATALMAGFAEARGKLILTLPAYHQVKGSELNRLVGALESVDLALGRRWPRAGGPLESLRRRAFHGLIARVTGLKFNDLGCGARAFHRRVLEEIRLYGDQHKFLALLADRQGFTVREVDLEQSPKDRNEGIYRPREYARSLLDIFSVFFLVRFTKKPLRFFGMAGVATFGVGALWAAILVIQRLFFAEPLADRPALLVASLLVVLGTQLFALGLLGELIIFTHARELKDYQVARVISFDPAGDAVGKDAVDAPVGRVVPFIATADSAR